MMKDGLIIENGTKRWYYHDMLHKQDLPAVIYSNGDTSWYFYDRLHRIDGPARVWLSWPHIEWGFNGDILSETEYKKVIYYYHLYQSIIREICF